MFSAPCAYSCDWTPLSLSLACAATARAQDVPGREDRSSATCPASETAGKSRWAERQPAEAALEQQPETGSQRLTAGGWYFCNEAVSVTTGSFLLCSAHVAPAMAYSSGSQRYIVKILGAQFGLSTGAVEDFLNDERTFASISDFLKGEERVPKLLFFYQTRDTFTDDGESPTSALDAVLLPADELGRARPIRMGTLKASKDGSSMFSAKRSLCPPADAGR